MDLEKGGLWRNWAGNQSCIAQYKGKPATEEQLVEMIAEADRRDLNVRVAGSSHSFTPVVGTGGLLLSLSAMQGVVGVDSAKKQVTISGGMRIHDVGKALRGLGYSLRNQGDIDSQAVVGAFTTGTHGTGLTLGCLATQIAGLRLVKADGGVLVVDGSDEDLLQAARVTIGTLGVISEITLQVTDAYSLHEKVWRDDFETCMARHDELAAKHRHFGFFGARYRKAVISIASLIQLMRR